MNNIIILLQYQHRSDRPLPPTAGYIPFAFIVHPGTYNGFVYDISSELSRGILDDELLSVESRLERL